MPDTIEWFGDHSLIGFVEKEAGSGIAFRKNGEEILFASREMVPLRWIKVGDFVPDPKAILSAEDVRKLMMEPDDLDDE